MMETNFSTNASFQVVETDFQASTNHKPFFCLVETYFYNESFIPAIGEGFSLYWKSPTLLVSSFLLAKTVTDMSGNHFLKTDPILAGGNLFLPLPQIFFKTFFIPASGNTFFTYNFFPASGSHCLYYRKASPFFSSIFRHSCY